MLEMIAQINNINGDAGVLEKPLQLTDYWF